MITTPKEFREARAAANREIVAAARSLTSQQEYLPLVKRVYEDHGLKHPALKP